MSVGRLYILLSGEQSLSRMMISPLTDTLASATAAAAASAARSAAATAAAGGSAATHAGGSGGRHQLGGDVYCCIAATLAVMGAATACNRSTDDWAYEQVVDLMLRLYREQGTGEMGGDGDGMWMSGSVGGCSPAHQWWGCLVGVENEVEP